MTKKLPAKRSKLPDLIGWDGTISPARYAVVGGGLFALKFGLDWSIAHLIFHRSWELWSYFLPGQTLDFLALHAVDRLFFMVILLLALPFIWMGVVLTMRRLRSAGVPTFWALLFFVPFVNLLFFLTLCVLPQQSAPALSAAPEPQGQLPGPEPAAGLPSPTVAEAREREAVTHDRQDIAYALLMTVPAAIGITWLCTTFFQAYGWGLFVGVPFVLPMMTAYLYGRRVRRSFQECLLIGCGAVTILGIGILLFAWEGAICLLMAAPIAYGLAFMGAALGYSMQNRQFLQLEQTTLSLLLLLAMPTLMGAESRLDRQPPLLAVKSCIDIEAPPAVVWNQVIAFPELKKPDQPLFKLGIAYPVGATIKGRGVGAVRKCRFSTGAFIEPIRVWREPELLKFGVIAQPPSMRELSWMHEIHPAHLEGYLDVQGGQFELKPLAGGKTRLEGTTWYENKMWPVSYWSLWSNYIIHSIHMRVLEHIKEQSQAAA